MVRGSFILFGSVSGIGDGTGIALVGDGTAGTVIGGVDDLVAIGMGEVGGKSGEGTVACRGRVGGSWVGESSSVIMRFGFVFC